MKLICFFFFLTFICHSFTSMTWNMNRKCTRLYILLFFIHKFSGNVWCDTWWEPAGWCMWASGRVPGGLLEGDTPAQHEPSIPAKSPARSFGFSHAVVPAQYFTCRSSVTQVCVVYVYELCIHCLGPYLQELLVELISSLLLCYF